MGRVRRFSSSLGCLREIKVFSYFFLAGGSLVSRGDSVNFLPCRCPVQFLADLYAQEDGEETRAAQGEYLTALGVGTQMVQ
jgi:hypothetical protein